MKYAEQLHFDMGDHVHPYFYEHIKEYTSRSLSFDADALNAFKGIIASYKEYTYWGLPLTAGFATAKVTAATSELAFAHSLAWVGRRYPPQGVPIRRRKDFPTWSWTSLVDLIETGDIQLYMLDANYVKCSSFYIQDEDNKWCTISDVFKRSLKDSESLMIPEHSKALLVEALVTQVWLRKTEVEGTCSVHVSNDHTHAQAALGSSVPSIYAEALIDGGDEELSAKLMWQPWYAVQLFWAGGLSSWMLVDRCDPVAQRIGLIRSWCLSPHEMSSLPSEKRVILIE